MRKYVWGIAVIVVALLSYLLIPFVDCDDNTKPDVPAAIDGVRDGMNIIKDKDGCPVTIQEEQK